MKPTPQVVKPAPAGFAGLSIVIASKNRAFGPDGGTLAIEADSLPFDDPGFCSGLVELAAREGIARKAVTDQPMFIETCQRTGAGDRKIVAEAEAFLENMESKDLSFEDVDKHLKAKYGWTLTSYDLNGLIGHFTRKAAKEAMETDPLAGL